MVVVSLVLGGPPRLPWGRSKLQAVLPLLEIVVQQLDVVDDYAVEHAVEVLGVMDIEVGSSVIRFRQLAQKGMGGNSSARSQRSAHKLLRSVAAPGSIRIFKCVQHERRNYHCRTSSEARMAFTEGDRC